MKLAHRSRDLPVAKLQNRKRSATWRRQICKAALFVFSTVAATSSADLEPALTLARDGVTEYSIVISPEAPLPERTAARELRRYLNRITGADFPIVQETGGDPQGPRILIGRSPEVEAFLDDVDWETLGSDGIAIRTHDDTLILAGGQPRGTLYAVYTFLEEVAGCRWWTSTAEFVPHKPTLDVPPLDIVYAPPFSYREAFYRDTNENPRFAARLKLNGHFNPIPPRLGGHYSIIGWCHTFFKWLPPEKYFAEHPEWYSEIDGKRTPTRSQLCLTNEEMRAEMIRVCLEQIRDDPSPGIISVSQNDWHGACRCPDCRALDAAEGSPAGTLLHFVNAVAEAIDREFPGFLVETLAYKYTRAPPRHVRPRANVIVRLCSIECSFTHPLESDRNAAFGDDLRGWSEIATNLYVWDYVTNFSNYILPHPNLRVLAPNLRFFAESNVTAVFAQGDRHTTVGDFVRLRAWVLSRLLWNPSLDPDKLAAEFLNGYYGPAGSYLFDYLNLVHDAADRSGAQIRCYNQDTSFLTFDDIREAVRLFEKAWTAVRDDATLAARVRRERLPLDHVRLLRHESLNREAEARNIPAPGPAGPAAAVEEFIRIVNSYERNHYSENRPFADYEPSLRLRFAPSPPTPGELASLPVDPTIVIQESELRLHNRPVWVEVVDDVSASNGKAARMPGNHTQWAVQFPVPREFASLHPGKWRWYAVVRHEAETKSGAAFSYGIYDTNANRQLLHLSAAIDATAGNDYRTLDLGVHDLRHGIYFWIAPPGNPAAVRSIYVDRIVLVRETDFGLPR